ncbi:hypothetical protein COU14_02770 [Candidatus Kaiserbacteria bacterium CG10_big_fil_rev_8_21_14_0_10_44_10]|uniref:Nudix hydrolase domain-containing protein n=1 Tax=Candidatus Kaiserbacteria bacterium CG10_big_fil_rev_8_21_14_0_10_44_10 TaxID=1974606 RepID=A0A2H0UH49_9BACT|nr:MAG: hypothetical protein COU14_02770 [Candidatus Kaiserbacteria bacterium CG10_big_fil_rev_8_21_14_0_10_44_10]
MKVFTVGLIFDSTLSEVVLMEKTHPEWQKGKLNGIGGKVEEGESVMECIVREVKEEAGVSSQSNDWIHFATLFEGVSKIEFFALKYTGNKSEIKTLTDEKVSWYPVNNLPQNLVAGIGWLVPLALEKLSGASLELVVAKYNSTS